MRTIEQVVTGYGLGRTGYTKTRLLMGIIFAESVVIGLQQVKSHWTISNQEMQTTYFRLKTFNRHMDIVTITKEVKDGSQK